MSDGVPRWSLRTQLIAVAIVALLVWTLNSVVIQPVRQALDDEQYIQAGYLAIRLVDQHVRSTSEWPKSWDDLQRVASSPSAIVQWPGQAEEMKARIQIDFQANAEQLAHAEPERLPAIRSTKDVEIEWIAYHYREMLNQWNADNVWLQTRRLAP